MTASAPSCPSQPSQDRTGVARGGETLRLLRLIRAWRWISGAPAPPINRGAWIHHENVAKAADVAVAAPSLGLVARRPCNRARGHAPRPRQAPNQFGVNDVVATTTRTRRRGCHNDAVGRTGSWALR